MISSDPFSSQMPFGNGISLGHSWSCYGVTTCFQNESNNRVTMQDVLFYWQKADAPLTEEFLLTFSGTHKIIATWIFFLDFQRRVGIRSKNLLHVGLQWGCHCDLVLLIHLQREAHVYFFWSIKQKCSVFLQDLVKINSLNFSIICKQLLPAHSVLDTLLGTSIQKVATVHPQYVTV